MVKNEVKKSPKERLKEITDSIETGIKEVFESEKYKSYLRTMSRFHNYSFNNKMLISMQAPNATLVAGYTKWKNEFSRNVKKGEQGIKIIAPSSYKVKEERAKLDPVTQAPFLDANGKIEFEEVERQMPAFRVVSVFDVSQTEGKEIPTLASTLDGSVDQYETFIEALKLTANVPINFATLSDDMDGYYHLKDKNIVIREGMSEIQTISVMIHEIAHSMLHDYELQKLDQVGEGTPIKKNRNTEEVEAESVSFAVCSYYGIETSENSFGYIASWSKNKELDELKTSLETIGDTSSMIITSLDKHFAELTKENEISIGEAGNLPQQAFTPECAITPEYAMTGEKIQTPRGNFALTSMTMEQMEASGYSVHHNSKDGKYAIMSNGTKAFAVNTESPLKTTELQTEQNQNMLDGIINNENKKSVLEELKTIQPKQQKEKPKSKRIENER